MTRLRQPELVLIDLDGTLVDSVPDLCVAANLMLADLGRRPLPGECIAHYVGNGIDRLIHRCLTRDPHEEAATDCFARARRLFFEHYSVHNGRHSRLYPGALDGIRQLRDIGITLACITNKASRFSEQVLRHFGIRDHFALLVAGDTLDFKKPHPQPLLHAAQELGVPIAASLMVGDSIHDVEAARAAGMPVVAVSYGYNHGRDIREAGADAVIDRLDQLGELFIQERHQLGSVTE